MANVKVGHKQTNQPTDDQPTDDQPTDDLNKQTGQKQYVPSIGS